MGELRGPDRVITLLEPPRPAGLTSGGFRYQERLVAAIGAAARRITVNQEHLHEHVRHLRATQPSGAVVVDGWFADLCDRPLPAGVTALMHMQPHDRTWAADVERAIATGASTADALRKHVATVKLVRPGIDECFAPRPRRGDNSLGIICSGTISEQKGQRRLVEALRDAPGPWRLTVVGSTSTDPEAVARLRATASTCPVTILDTVSPDVLADLYAQHDLFVSLSSSESYGMAAAEAVAAGLPMFGLATGELHSFGRNDARWLLPVDATDNAIATALHGLMSRPDALRDSRGVAVTAPRSWAEVAAEFVAACR